MALPLPTAAPEGFELLKRGKVLRCLATGAMLWPDGFKAVYLVMQGHTTVGRFEELAAALSAAANALPGLTPEQWAANRDAQRNMGAGD